MDVAAIRIFAIEYIGSYSLFSLYFFYIRNDVEKSRWESKIVQFVFLLP